MKGVDFFHTQADATLACLRANGFEFVCRYYDDSFNTSAKSLDQPEAQLILSHGMYIATVYETTGGAPGFGLDGATYFKLAKGREDGGYALVSARNAGQPKHTPIFFAVDYDAQATEDFEVITEYFNGIYEQFQGEYQIGVYGEYAICMHAKQYWPAVTAYWQTYAWSGGQRMPEAQIYQYENGQNFCGVTVDLNVGEPRWWGPTQGGTVTDDEFLEKYTRLVAPGLEGEFLTRKEQAISEATQRAWLHGHNPGTVRPLIFPASVPAGAEYAGSNADMSEIFFTFADGTKHKFVNGQEVP